MARRIVREAEEVDTEEERRYGPENNPYMNPLPSDWKERLKQLREARKAIEERERKKGKPAPQAKTQYNFTDPDSRIVQESGNKAGYVPRYNAQIVVEAETQVIACVIG